MRFEWACGVTRTENGRPSGHSKCQTVVASLSTTRPLSHRPKLSLAGLIQQVSKKRRICYRIKTQDLPSSDCEERIRSCKSHREVSLSRLNKSSATISRYMTQSCSSSCFTFLDHLPLDMVVWLGSSLGSSWVWRCGLLPIERIGPPHTGTIVISFVTAARRVQRQKLTCLPDGQQVARSEQH